MLSTLIDSKIDETRFEPINSDKLNDETSTKIICRHPICYRSTISGHEMQISRPCSVFYNEHNVHDVMIYDASDQVKI